MKAIRNFGLSILTAVSLFVAGCSTTLGDAQQVENLKQIHESYTQIFQTLVGQPDDPTTPDVDESVAPRIPDRLLLESHADLVRESYELELAKRKTWQDMAQAEGWAPAE